MMPAAIHKFPVYPGMNYHHCGDIIHFDHQGHGLFIWAKTSNVRNRVVNLVMTGQEYNYSLFTRHIGTVVLQDEGFVVHAFEA